MRIELELESSEADGKEGGRVGGRKLSGKKRRKMLNVQGAGKER